MADSKKNSNNEKKLKWWQLSLLGVACTIGTGYFLGSGVGITIGGPSIIFNFLLAALGTYIVFDALARMTVNEPLEGSFRSYAKKAYGRWAGFSSGWVYWSSEMLIMGSQLTALSLFTRFWFPNVPLWIFATIYGLLGLGVILTGTSGFDKLENVFAVAKIAAILMFLILATLALFHVFGEGKHKPNVPMSIKEIFPHGFLGYWSSLLYAFYSFGGIEIMGLMAIRLTDPKKAPTAGKIMLLLLTIIYILSLGLAVTLIPFDVFNTKQSPFVLSLEHYDLKFVPHVFHGVFIIAGFSTMVASLFAVTTIIVTLADDHDAPSFFAKKSKGKRQIPFRAMLLTASGLTVSIVVALLLPGKIYEYITTAAGLMLLYNWVFILLSARKLLEKSTLNTIKRIVGALLILAAVSGTVIEKTTRPGLLVSLGFVAVIALVALLMRKKWKEEEQESHATK